MKRLFIIIFIAFVSSAYSQGLSQEEKQLADLINEYRKSKKIPPLKISKSLTLVAKIHTSDLNKYENEIKKGCNMHSWSKHGKWKPVDYYEDHRNAEGMWSKPEELTPYKGNGYEIAFWDLETCTARECLKGWKSSPGHNTTILQSGIWKGTSFVCMGISINKNYAVVWFGEEEDPAGYLP